jgi:hypothetical protein
MFTIKLESKRNLTSAIFVCPKCFGLANKAFWWDTPIRSVHDRCWTCQSRLPDYESLIRNVAIRKQYHFTKELPKGPRQMFY